MFMRKIVIDNSLKHILCLLIRVTRETVEDSSAIILNCIRPHKSDSSFQSSTPFRPQTFVFILRDKLAFVLVCIKDGLTLVWDLLKLFHIVYVNQWCLMHCVSNEIQLHVVVSLASRWTPITHNHRFKIHRVNAQRGTKQTCWMLKIIETRMNV